MPIIDKDGKPWYFCPRCRKWYTDPVVVTASTRKNRLGRIAWVRDGICLKCAIEEVTTAQY